jgi:hypothetical protein
MNKVQSVEVFKSTSIFHILSLLFCKTSGLDAYLLWMKSTADLFKSNHTEYWRKFLSSFVALNTKYVEGNCKYTLEILMSP